jgi:S-adenosylmethionine/arginine decarboxylase-like enzyme
MIVHVHTIVDAIVRRTPQEVKTEELEAFLRDLVDLIGMKKLFEPIAINGKYGHTGIVGIVTSHIAFHYFDDDRSLHFDVYSCKSYDTTVVLDFLNRFWGIEKAVVHVIDREGTVSVTRLMYRDNELVSEVGADA